MLKAEVDGLLNLLKLLCQRVGHLADSTSALLVFKHSVEDQCGLNPAEGGHIISDPLVACVQVYKQEKLLVIVHREPC